MPGAYIPDDWDGVSYRCTSLQMPDSLKYRAFLLGQLSEAANPEYWDPESGDPDEAAQAIDTAYRLSILEPTLDCPEGGSVPIYPPVSFRVYATGIQQLAASVWSQIIWNQYHWNWNNPGFDLADDRHHPGSQSRLGLWRYELQIYLDGLTNVSFAAQGSVSFNHFYAAANQVLVWQWSWLHPVTDASDRIKILVNPGTTRNTQPSQYNVWWSGQWLGPQS